ncbi:MAG: BTAD domain-containing putative transcriptional regulator [Pseudomonadota bacterium]
MIEHSESLLHQQNDDFENIQGVFDRSDYNCLLAILDAQKFSKNSVANTELETARNICRQCIEIYEVKERYRWGILEAERQEQQLRDALRGCLEFKPKAFQSDLPDPIGCDEKVSRSPGLWERLRSSLSPPENPRHTEKQGTSICITSPSAGDNQEDREVLAQTQSTPSVNNEPWGLTVHCLGKFQVLDTGIPIDDWPNRKSKLVFKYLIAHRTHPVTKDSLMDAFWPNTDPGHARNSLNVAIYRIRQTLTASQPHSHILYQDNCYLINPDIDVWVDAEVFSECIKNAQRFERQGDQPAAIREYQAADTLYQGPFLDEERYEPWTELQRQDLEIQYVQMLETLIAYHIESEDYDRCIACCNKLLAVDVCQEEVHQQIMRCYSRQKRVNLAVRQFHCCVRALKHELDLVPSTATLEMYRRIRQFQLV